MSAFSFAGDDTQLGQAMEQPLERSAIVIRGRKDHPCVSFTCGDIGKAKQRIAAFPWAQHERDKIVAEADRWLKESDAYWLRFLPGPGACYAYGFTGCPICNASTGTWGGARCTWDNPGHVSCANGHVLPDADHPDDGKGYTAPDGRIHYFAGQFNAWATEQWTLHALPSLTQAYALTGDERYADRGTLLLDALASIYAESTSGSWDYPSTPPSGRFARPWYQVARTLVYYVDQYDLVYDSPAMEQASLRPDMKRRENIERYLLEDAAYYCYHHSFDGALHNGHADYMRGALAVGCLLDIPEYVRISVDGPFSISSMLANNIDRDGRYYETATGYAVHARLLYLTFADPLRNLRNAEHPNGINLYDDPAFQTCMLLPELQIMCAGRMPNFGDAGPDVACRPFPARPFSAVDYGFLERLYASCSNETQRTTYGAAIRWLAEEDVDKLRDGSTYRNWLLWHAADVSQAAAGLPAEIEGRVLGSWVAGMKGMAILRAGTQAALVRFGPSLNHGDLDDLGLLYYANGREPTYDIGYGLGSTHVHVGWASSTVSHCLVTVDEKNQLEADGSGGSVRFFADLPHVKVVQATSENSYSSERVTQYQRTVALVDGAYLLDVFEVAGGHQHDFGFGSVGDDLTPFGVAELKPQEGSLAEGVAWGQNIGADGDIKGYPNKPYWNPPPGNGYGFFYNVRGGQPAATWGGVWRLSGDAASTFRMHVAGDPAEALFATAPGLYPRLPVSSYVIARRKGDDLRSTFIAVYEPYQMDEARPILDSVRRLSGNAVEIRRVDGAVAVALVGPGKTDSPYGAIEFDGDFAYLTGDGHAAQHAEIVGCTRLRVGEKVIDSGPAAFSATITDVDLDARTVRLDQGAPEDAVGRVAVFSNPAYSRTTAYHVLNAEGLRLTLEASRLTLGKGRVLNVSDATHVTSDIPHEYARSVSRGGHSTRFFDGKRIRGERGGVTRVTSTTPGAPLELTVEDANALSPGETFVYQDLAPGDTVRIACARTLAF